MKKAIQERDARLLKEKESRKMVKETEQLQADLARYDEKLEKNMVNF